MEFKKFENLMKENNLHYEYCEIPPNSVLVNIRWGDWKHDHAYFKFLVLNRFSGATIKQRITDEDDSDCYSAEYTITF